MLILEATCSKLQFSKPSSIHFFKLQSWEFGVTTTPHLLSWSFSLYSSLISTERNHIVRRKKIFITSTNLRGWIIVTSAIWRSIWRPLPWCLTRDRGRSFYGVILWTSQRARDRIRCLPSWTRDNGMLARASERSSWKKETNLIS